MQTRSAKVIGMINYLAKSIPNMSELTASLRPLLKSDVPWTWFPEHDTALTKLKSVLSSAPVLRFYDTSLPTTLQVDASKHGLGACLMQQNQPVAYASRAMSSSETITPKFRKNSWQSFMGVRDSTCTQMGQKLKYSLITSL